MNSITFFFLAALLWQSLSSITYFKTVLVDYKVKILEGRDSNLLCIDEANRYYRYKPNNDDIEVIEEFNTNLEATQISIVLESANDPTKIYYLIHGGNQFLLVHILNSTHQNNTYFNFPAG